MAARSFRVSERRSGSERLPSKGRPSEVMSALMFHTAGPTLRRTMWVFVCVCACVCVLVCVCVCMFMCIYACMYECKCVCVCLCVRACTFDYVYVCMYVLCM